VASSDWGRQGVPACRCAGAGYPALLGGVEVPAIITVGVFASVLGLIAIAERRPSAVVIGTSCISCRETTNGALVLPGTGRSRLTICSSCSRKNPSTRAMQRRRLVRAQETVYLIVLRELLGLSLSMALIWFGPSLVMAQPVAACRPLSGPSLLGWSPWVGLHDEALSHLHSRLAGTWEVSLPTGNCQPSECGLGCRASGPRLWVCESAASFVGARMRREACARVRRR
jgi:hypothetical protein